VIREPSWPVELLLNVGLESVVSSFYVIESGILRASYEYVTDTPHIVQESMLPGTVAGEMTFLSNSPRNATVVAERDAVVWRMGQDDHKRMEEAEGMDTARKFRQLLLRSSVEESEGELEGGTTCCGDRILTFG
jgi:SulP family sulfate permease